MGMISLAEEWADLWTIKFAQLVQNHPVAVACSGGADSVALLYWAVQTFGQERVEALHFNHRTRAEQNEQDWSFVESLAQQLGVAFRGGVAPRDMSNANEADLRSARMDFFSRSLLKLDGSFLLQGHHADDAMESFVMRLSRGAGLDGLLTPKSISQQDRFTIVRPLLPLTRATIRDALQKRGIVWREDKSNASDQYYRNRIRHQLLPLWNKLSPAALPSSLRRSMMLLQEDQDALQNWTDQVWKSAYQDGNLRVSVLASLPDAIVRRALEKFMTTRGLGDFVGAASLDVVLRKLSCDEDFSVQIGNNLYWERRKNVLSLEEKSSQPAHTYDIFCAAYGTIYLPDGQLTLQQTVLSSAMKESILSGKVAPATTAFIHFSTALQRLQIRTWRPGDTYLPLGAKGRRKLQDWFSDYKIPQSLRHRLPLVVLDEEIVWVPHFAPAHAYRLEPHSQSALALTYHGE